MDYRYILWAVYNVWINTINVLFWGESVFINVHSVIINASLYCIPMNMWQCDDNVYSLYMCKFFLSFIVTHNALQLIHD